MCARETLPLQRLPLFKDQNTSFLAYTPPPLKVWTIEKLWVLQRKTAMFDLKRRICYKPYDYEYNKILGGSYVSAKDRNYRHMAVYSAPRQFWSRKTRMARTTKNNGNRAL